jgi:hypothetical protein
MKKSNFNCTTNGGIMVVSALRYAFGRYTYVPGAVQDWITDHWDNLDSNTRCVIVRDVFEYLYDEYKRDLRADSPFGDYDTKTWEKFGIERCRSLDDDERKRFEAEISGIKERGIWYKEAMESKIHECKR